MFLLATRNNRDDTGRIRSARPRALRHVRKRLASQQQRDDAAERLARAACKRSWPARWNKTLSYLADLGATVKQHEEALGDKEKTVYEVTFEGKTSHFRSRFQVQRWLKRERERQEEQQMSWAERHVQWMIDHNCDDHGHPWPDWEES